MALGAELKRNAFVSQAAALGFYFRGAAASAPLQLQRVSASFCESANQFGQLSCE